MPPGSTWDQPHKAHARILVEKFMSLQRTTAYRYPTEQGILFLTFLAVFVVILLTAALTFRLGLLIIAFTLVAAYLSNLFQHQALIRSATKVSTQSAPALTRLAQECVQKLQPGPIQIFIAQNPALNAYTFGLTNPRVVVLYSSLFREMDGDEIRFVLGHELGHICLGHTWLNSIAGGMAGIPSTFLISSILKGILLWWNRACEYSADRAGLLACGRADKAVSALVKLAAGPAGLRNPQDLERVLRAVQDEADDPLNIFSETMATHPLILKRINAIRRYAGSSGYQRLQREIDANC